MSTPDLDLEGAPNGDAQRVTDAMAFLREAVFQSRARQAAGVALKGGDLNAVADGPANCGLGEKAAVELDLSAEARSLFERLWPSGLETDAMQTVHTVMDAWVRKQDALDRTRNHFLRDFRQEHGFDRRSYAPEVLRAFEAGLEGVNAEVDAALSEHARELVDLA